MSFLKAWPGKKIEIMLVLLIIVVNFRVNRAKTLGRWGTFPNSSLLLIVQWLDNRMVGVKEKVKEKIHTGMCLNKIIKIF